MSCEDVRELLGAYDGDELEPARVASLETHLSGCPSCRAELEEHRTLRRAARRWGAAVEPDRDLWPGIERRIAGGTVARGPWWYVARAGLAAAALLAVALILGRPVEEHRSEPASVATAPSSTDVGLAASVARAAEEARVRDGLLHVREDLLRSIEERRGRLDPATLELVDRNLEIIDRAIGEIQQALDEHPESRELELMLAATYQREAELLKQINVL